MKKLKLSLLLMFLFLAGSVFAQKDSFKPDSSQIAGQKIPSRLMTKISVDFKDVTFENALNVISDKINLRFNYNRDRIPVDQKITLSMQNVPALDILDDLLQKTKTEFKITKEGQIIILPIETKYRKGSIDGKVIDENTLMPLPGANIMLAGTSRGTASDQNGNFTIPDVPVGSYTLIFKYIGYQTLDKTDIIVRSNRITNVQVTLSPVALEGKTVTVTGGYFSQSQDQPTSVINFASEEIRRAPGSAGDVSRIIYGLPGISKVDDSKNSLIVRGGAACENGFYIDNIEIPNINHFPEYGSSGGPIGMLNVDFIRDVNFYTGGFSTIYGDKLSSIMELSFREGNRNEFDGQLDLNFAGFGGIAEGPLSHGKGSWLFSARKSFLDFIVGAIGEDQNSVPNYGDIQSKVVYDISPKNQLTFLNILGIDDIKSDKEYAIENEEETYMSFNMIRNTAGINWRSLWNHKGYSNTSLSHTITKVGFISHDTRIYHDTMTEKKLFEIRPSEHEIKFRNVNYYSINPSQKIQFGFELKQILNRYNHYFGENKDALGNDIKAFQIVNHLNTLKAFGFISYHWRPLTRLTLEPGVRIGHFTYNKKTEFSPRLSVSYQLDDLTSINGSTGIFHQYLPLELLTQNTANKNLNTPLAYHLVVGVNRLLTENTRLTVEVYDKEYKNLPLDPLQPTFCIIDQMATFGLFYNPNPLVDNGKAYTRGIEMMLQKKLARNLYGMVSVSYFRAKYKDYNQIWRNRLYDNRITFNAEGGYKPDSKWEFSLRWIYAGGRPYTPFDIDASQQAFQGVYDESRTNTLRLPNYHSLNIRFDRRYQFSGSNMIFYFSIWNAYNRKNLSSYDWNGFKNEQTETTQWGFLPIFGLEYEF